MIKCPGLYETALAIMKFDISKTTGNGDVTKIKCPVQLIYGLCDLQAIPAGLVVSAKEIGDKCEVHAFPDWGHFFPVDKVKMKQVA